MMKKLERNTIESPLVLNQKEADFNTAEVGSLWRYSPGWRLFKLTAFTKHSRTDQWVVKPNSFILKLSKNSINIHSRWQFCQALAMVISYPADFNALGKCKWTMKIVWVDATDSLEYLTRVE